MWKNACHQAKLFMYVHLRSITCWAPPPPPPPQLSATRPLHAKSVGEYTEELQNEEPINMEEAKILGSSRDGKHIVREHVIQTT